VGVPNAFCALQAQEAGFNVIYLSGAGVANMVFGRPDLGLTSRLEVVAEASRITAATPLPLLVDADTGWGDEIGTCVQDLERAGVAGMHIEDQVEQKRCGHRPGKRLVSTTEMQARLAAALAERQDSRFVIMARTDASRVEGLVAAIDRSLAYIETGADMIFVEALTSLSEYQQFTAAVRVPVLANLTEFGQTPLFDSEQMARHGVRILLYPLSAFRVMSKSVEGLYTSIRKDGSQRAWMQHMQTREELYELLDYHTAELAQDAQSEHDHRNTSQLNRHTKKTTGVIPLLPAADTLLNQLTDYALDYTPTNTEAYDTARYCLVDSLGCALASLDEPECRRVLGPFVDNITINGGIFIPGLEGELEPVQAAFNLGTMIRWLDFNDTWLAAEWGHPSDNLGGILVAACLQEKRRCPVSVRSVLTAMIKAYEIQGCLALGNNFHQFGLDHVILVRVATALVTAVMLGASRQQVFNALSNAWVDGGNLRSYRHAPDTGSRKGWAAGDATARGLWLAFLTMRGEMGYPHTLSTPSWGFQDSLLHGQELTLTQSLDCYVMQNILFKVAFPAEFHAQTAVEAAIQLHAIVDQRYTDIRRIVIETQQAGMRIINKTGRLKNPADRDHCLQYIVAVALLRGRLTREDYHDNRAADPRIEQLRLCMEVTENSDFTHAYHDPSRRAIPNAIQIFFTDGSHSKRIEVNFPLGHHQRRKEAWPQLQDKFRQNTNNQLDMHCCEKFLALLGDSERFDAMPVGNFIQMLHGLPIASLRD